MHMHVTGFSAATILVFAIGRPLARRASRSLADLPSMPTTSRIVPRSPDHPSRRVCSSREYAANATLGQLSQSAVATAPAWSAMYSRLLSGLTATHDGSAVTFASTVLKS